LTWRIRIPKADKSYTALQTVRHRFYIYASSCVALALMTRIWGTANSLHASALYGEYNERFSFDILFEHEHCSNETKRRCFIVVVTVSSEKPLVPEDSPPVEVKVRSTVAEEFSPKLLISKPDELRLLEDFIRTKVSFKKKINK